MAGESSGAASGPPHSHPAIHSLYESCTRTKCRTAVIFDQGLAGFVSTTSTSPGILSGKIIVNFNILFKRLRFRWSHCPLLIPEVQAGFCLQAHGQCVQPIPTLTLGAAFTFRAAEAGSVGSQLAHPRSPVRRFLAQMHNPLSFTCEVSLPGDA